VNGTLGVDAGGTLAFDASIALTVGVSGRLSLIGTPDDRARLTAAGPGGYGVTVNGTLEAMNFLAEFMGPAGLVIPQGATIAAAPFDCRNGFFDNPSAIAGACLLDVQRAAPTDFRYCVFEKSNGVLTANNVRCTGGAAVTFTNWAGSLGGASFENDPGSRVTWNGAQVTTAAFFAGTPGVSKATLVWILGQIFDAEAWILERSDGGPFVEVHETAVVGVGPYAFVDDPLVPLVTYTYRLSERLTHGEIVVLGTTMVTPFTAPPPANLVVIGPSEAVTTLQEGVDLAAASGGALTILQVLPGTYAPFTLTATPPGGLRILATDAGATIDTTSGPVRIQNLALGQPVEMAGFVIGSAGSGQIGLRIQDCLSPVSVDDVVVTGGAGQPAVRVSNCPLGVSLTRIDATGTPGVRVQTSAVAAVSGGVVNSLSLAANARVETCDLGGPSVTNDGTATHDARPGVMPTLAATRFVSIGTPLVFDFQGAPAAYWALLGGLSLDYASYAPIVEMPLVMNVLSIFVWSEQFTSGAGQGQYAAIFPPAPALLGLPISWQALQFDFAYGIAYRLSNPTTVVPVP
jgi:hypothetical protein